MARPKILLVDDTRLVLELEKNFLKFSEVEILTAANGAEALEMIRKDVPDLIFMDVNMPVMDGVACCQELKADPFLSGIPIVMLTSAGNDKDRERAQEAGCDDYLTKPVNRHDFLNMAHRYAAVERRVPRVACRVPALLIQDAWPVNGEIIDVGDGGVFVSSRMPLRRELPIKVAFYLPIADAVIVEATGRVAWLNAGEMRPKPSLPAGFGVEFIRVEEEILANIRRFVQEVARQP